MLFGWGLFSVALDYIDVPQQRANNGVRTEQFKAGNKRYRVEDTLENFKSFFVQKRPYWQNYLSVDMSVPKDPSLYLSVDNIARIQCLLRGTESQSPIVNVRSFNNTKPSRERFATLVDRLFTAEKSTELKSPNSNPYCKIVGGGSSIELSQAAALLARFEEALLLIKNYGTDLNPDAAPFLI